MNYRRLLGAMMMKEIRTSFRVRAQLLGFVITLVVMTVILVFAMRGATQDRQSPLGQAGANQHIAWSHEQVMAIRWVSIGIGAGLGLFFSLGYLISATLASFAGEKETGTLEILLAAPIGDSQLFFTKCLSILLPMAAVGYLFVLAAGGAVMIAIPHIVHLPVNVFLYGCAASIPLSLLPQMALVGLGAAISARAGDQKTAGQLFGAVFFVIFFGGFYGMPLLVTWLGLKPRITTYLMSWLELPFPAQYAAALALIAVPTAILVALGRASFRRERLLA